MAIQSACILRACLGARLSWVSTSVNRVLASRCRPRLLSRSPWRTRGYNAGQVVRVPVAHGEGNYIADGETIARLEGEGRVLFRYSSPDGMIDPNWNHNGAINAIAGILNERGNVLGMMPHPENHVEAAIGPTDGRGLFAGLAEALERAA